MSPIEKLILFFGILIITFLLRTIFLYIIDKKVSNILKTRTEINKSIIQTVKNLVGYFIVNHTNFARIKLGNILTTNFLMSI